MGLEIEGAMQHAPHPGRQDIVSGGDDRDGDGDGAAREP